MMITMFEVLQLVETIGKQFPHHHSTNSSRLKWLFRHHPFCYPQIFIFCCGDFPPKQLFYFWKLLLKSRRLCHGGWKSNFHAALRFECWYPKMPDFLRHFSNPVNCPSFFPFPCKIEVRKAAAKEIVFACLVVILFKHCCFSSSLCLSKSSSDIFNYRTL